MDQFPRSKRLFPFALSFPAKNIALLLKPGLLQDGLHDLALLAFRGPPLIYRIEIHGIAALAQLIADLIPDAAQGLVFIRLPIYRMGLNTPTHLEIPIRPIGASPGVDESHPEPGHRPRQ